MRKITGDNLKVFWAEFFNFKLGCFELLSSSYILLRLFLGLSWIHLRFFIGSSQVLHMIFLGSS